jgi:tetratricopeptide (TPR) repeat protein
MQPRRPEPSEAQAIEALLTQQQFGQALVRSERWAARAPREAVAWLAIVRSAIPTGRLARAADAADRGLRLAPNDPQLGLLRGVVDHRLGRSDAAVDRLRALLAKRPPNATEVAIALIESLHRAGRADEVDALLAEGADWARDERVALFRARAMARTDREAACTMLVSVVASARSPLLKRIAGFEAVRMLDAAGRYREAFELASRIHGDTTPAFDVGGVEDDLAAQMRQLEKGRAWFTPKGPPSERLAFVVGMPRSGTTLLEQMLDRHPQVGGIGEYEGAFTIHEGLVGLGLWPQGLRDLQASDAARLAAEYHEGAQSRRRGTAGVSFDKTLHVWRLLPAIHAVLPGASFVHIERDPRDTAISMFLSNFHPKSWGFTRDLASIRRVMTLERRVVAPAFEVLGLRGTRVVYERLVDDPEREIRRVLDGMGLPFDASVLSPEENRRTVLTLSYEQVRRKINRASIQRWKNYEFAFDGSWDALAAHHEKRVAEG